MDLLDTQAAADELHKLIPEQPGYWHRYLLNNRRTDRTPAYRIRFRRRTAGVFYDPADLADFTAWEKQRRHGIRKQPGRDGAITVRLDPHCLEALKDLERRTEIPASEILESMFPALLHDLWSAMDAAAKAPEGRERAALQAWCDKRKEARQ